MTETVTDRPPRRTRQGQAIGGRAGWIGAAVLLLAQGCASSLEASLDHDLDTAMERFAPAEDAPPLEQIDGRLESYVEAALARTPELRASLERWRAASLRVSRARAFPDPVVMYGYYARPVHTRVGPQEHRLSVRQDVPWPVRLTAAADAKALEARSLQRRFEARALDVREAVARAWWELWYLRRAIDIRREQRTLVEGLAEVLRGQLAVDRATLADVGQVELTMARIDDSVSATEERIATVKAELLSSLGVVERGGLELPTLGEGRAVLPEEPVDALREAVRTHPYLESFDWRARSAEARARSLRAERYPSFSLGVDWIVTGEALMPATQSSGDDAVVLNVGVRVPLWQGAYGEASESAEAEASATRFERLDAEASALAVLDAALSSVRDSHRRVTLYRDTLLPQAQSVFESVTGAFTTGRATVAATLLAERDLLEIAVGLERAYADHGRAWASLERVVGRPVSGREPTEPEVEPESTEPEAEPESTEPPADAEREGASNE